MKTKKEITDKIKELKANNKLKQPTATIAINAPLALCQLELESEIKALEWVLK